MSVDDECSLNTVQHSVLPLVNLWEFKEMPTELNAIL